VNIDIDIDGRIMFFFKDIGHWLVSDFERICASV
jgi:hypothetical protein